MTAPEDVDPDRYHVERATVRGVDLAFVHEGAGGVPLLLVHGWPDSKRIWWRNIGILARRGFEVIAPDLRGYGDSGVGPDGWHDVPTFSRDLHALVSDHLGHPRVVGAAGDLGARVVQDMDLRFPGAIDRMVLWNCALPITPAMAGLRHLPRAVALDYHVRNGTDADGLAAELDSPERRRRYVAGMYTSRWWAHPDSFDAESIAFQTEPYGDEASFRAGLGHYESVYRPERRSEEPLMAPTGTPTLVLFGAADHVVAPDFDRMATHVFADLTGPYVLSDAGHFVPWEAASTFNASVTTFCGDLLASPAAPALPETRR